jgi:hypothetical protein
MSVVQGDIGGVLAGSWLGGNAADFGRSIYMPEGFTPHMGLGLQNNATAGRQCCLEGPCRMIGVGIMTWYKHSVEH